MQTLTEQLMERWEQMDAERRRAVGPNPQVVASLSFPIGQLGQYASLSHDELLARADKK